MMDGFSVAALIQAMAPTARVLETFERDYPREENDETTEENQRRFAAVIENERSKDMGPSERYLRNLVRSFVRLTEQERGQMIENDEMMELVLWCSLFGDQVPDGGETCYQSFQIPHHNNQNHNHQNHHNSSSSSSAIPSIEGHGTVGNSKEPMEATPIVVKLRVYPMHNDVALKLWEAGAFLAEYMIHYPERWRNQVVVETGAGVGLTGFVCAACCPVQHFHLTDYTDACLENLQHNSVINRSLWEGKIHEPSTKPVIVTTVSRR